MAATSIWAIKGTAFAIHRVECYIENPEKTHTPEALEAQHEFHQRKTTATAFTFDKGG